MSGKCPNPTCGKLITEIKGISLPIKGNKRIFPGSAYICPYCSTILGCGLDPLLSIEAIVNQVVKNLQR